MGRDREESRRRGGEDDERRPRERERASRRGDDDEEYQPSESNLQRRATSSGGNYDKIIKDKFITFRAQEGQNCIRILPPTWRDEGDKLPSHYGLDVYIHRNVGIDRQTYLCLKSMKGEKCPICAMRLALEKEGDVKAAKALKVGKQVAMWIIDRDDEKAGPQIYTMPQTLDTEIADLSLTKKGIVNVVSKAHGHDITFKRVGSDIQTDYTRIVIEPDESPISEDDDVVADWLAFIKENPIPSVLNYYEADYLADVCEGGVSAQDKDELDEDDEERVGRGRGRSDRDESRSRRGRHEEDDDEREASSRSARRGRTEEVEPDEDDELRGRARSRARPEDDDEIPSESRRTRGRSNGEDNDDAAPDEEDKPRSTARRSLKKDDDEGGDDDSATRVRERITDRLQNRR